MQAYFSRMGARRWIINDNSPYIHVNCRDFAAFVLEERFWAYAGVINALRANSSPDLSRERCDHGGQGSGRLSVRAAEPLFATA
jgi:hypothetical protein